MSEQIEILKKVFKWGYSDGWFASHYKDPLDDEPTGVRVEQLQSKATAIADIDPWTRVEDGLPKHYVNIEICYDGADALLTKHQNKYCHGYMNTLGFYKEIDNCVKLVLIKQKVLAWRLHIPFAQENIKIEVKTIEEFLTPPKG